MRKKPSETKAAKKWPVLLPCVLYDRQGGERTKSTPTAFPRQLRAWAAVRVNSTQDPLHNLDKSFLSLSHSSHSWLTFLALAPCAVLM